MSRVLFILHIPPPVHGSSVVGQQICDSAVIHAGWTSEFVNLNTSPSTDAIGRVSLGKIFTYAGILARTLRALLFRRPRLAYIAITVKGGAFFKDALVVALVKLFCVPIVYHLHNKGVASCQDRRPYCWLYPWVFRRCRVILLSKHLYPDIARFVPEDAVEICPNGIPDAAESFMRKHGKTEPPAILFLSNLIESKGVFVLLEACALLKAQGLAFRAEFIGGEADVTADRFIARCQELGLNDEVSYLGKQYGVEKDTAFASASIFVLPTFNDCFPLVLLEAMMWQLPVVATPEGGISEIVADGETGFLVPQRDAAPLADKLALLLRDGALREEMGNAGRKRYEAQFTPSRFERIISVILTRSLERKT